MILFTAGGAGLIGTPSTTPFSQMSRLLTEWAGDPALRVERRELNQWFFRITEFSEALLEDLKQLERWPAKVRVMQENWIGRSEGMQVWFELENREDRLQIFTTRHDTIFGATFCAISADHPLSAELAEKRCRADVLY